MSGERQALIVGAGIGGLAAAVALRSAGWTVRVLERAASPRELGFALALAPNALKALRELGLADVVIARGAEVHTFEVRRLDGAFLKRVTFVDRGPDTRSVVTLRPALHGALLEAIPASALHLNHDVRDITIGPREAEVTLADGSRAAAGILIGADGKNLPISVWA